MIGTTALVPERATLTLGGAWLAVRADPPAEAALPLALAFMLDRGGRRQVRPAPLLSLVGLLVDDGDREDLTARLAARRRPIPWAVLGDAVAWMAEQATGRPLGEAVILAAWASSGWRAWRGRLLARGAALPATLPDLLDVAHALACEDAAGQLRAMEAVDKALASGWPERDTWGADGAEGMMEMLTRGSG